MTISLKKIYFTAFLALLVGTISSYSQSENEKINNLIEQKRNFNKKNKSSIVYKIQLYNGYETEAYKIKRNFEASFPEYKTFIDASKQPDWKTQVGNFNTRIEADRVLIIIKDKFSGAIVLEDKI
ncbi:SPOR domain-containing protein [uncultured Lutibacter sp.]|uniref:SPOR domain-containing protein n=1 Tax=uncultured Lutibacter sp. TaxID=437739 RepID=UPI00262D46A0|nr:SPOR domain-containing protein [uncultured Lutibacter sp.]